MLVRASVAIRYAATSTAAGSGGTVGRHVEADPDRRAVGPPAELLGPLPQGADQARARPARAGAGRRPRGVRRPGRRGCPGAALSSSSVVRSGSVDQVRGGVGGERDAGQGRAEPVVQLAAQPPALLLPRPDQPLARGLQLGGDDGGVHGDRQRRRQQAEHPPVRGRPAVARPRAGRPSSAPTTSPPYVSGQSRPRARDAAPSAASTVPSRSRATYGSRRLCRIERGHAGAARTSGGRPAARPSSETTRAGSARSPYIARSTSRCSRGSSGRGDQHQQHRGDRRPASVGGDDPVEHGDQRRVRHDHRQRQQQPGQRAGDAPAGCPAGRAGRSPRSPPAGSAGC